MSLGHVGSVLLFGDRPPDHMRDIAFPTDSSTLKRLLRWYLGEQGWTLDASTWDRTSSLCSAMRRRPPHRGPRTTGCIEYPSLVQLDLGAEWTRTTGLPMVFGIFAAHRSADRNPRSKQGPSLSRLQVIPEGPEQARGGGSAGGRKDRTHADRMDQYFLSEVSNLRRRVRGGPIRFLVDVCGGAERGFRLHSLRCTVVE